MREELVNYRLIELFSGVGAQAKALDNIGFKFERYLTCEWEVNAVASYKAIHMPNDNTDYSKDLTKEELVEYLFNKGISTNGKEPLTYKQVSRKSEQWLRTVYNNIKATNNLVNISQVSGDDLGIVDTDKNKYILTYSFPCQDISIAGKGAGLSKGSGTRSGLLWEVERLLKEVKHLPDILLMENVTQIHNKKHIDDFNQWISFLESLGYSNYWQDLNAKDYTIPQNRNRTFMVSILGGHKYEFPKPVPLKLRLKDMLEDKVDEKYYLSDKMVKYISKKGTNGYANKDARINLDIARPITTEQNKRAGTTSYICKDLPKNANLSDLDVERLFGLYDERGKGKQGGSVFNKEGLCPTITTGASNNWNVLINDEGESKDNKPQTKRLYGIYDKNGKRHQAGSFYDINGLASTLDTAQDGNRQPCIEMPEATKKGHTPAINGTTFRSFITKTEDRDDDVGVVENGLRIRKLTPKECWRLMGFDDEDFERAEKVNSNTQLYKQAGNSIVVPVLEAIFRELLLK